MSAVISCKRQQIYLSFIIVLGTILRLVRLGSQSFSYDEVYSASIAAKSLGTAASSFGNTPELHHILLHFWLYLGRSDIMIRLPSVLFGIATLWVVYLLGKNFLDVKHGLVCALLLAISPFHIWYSQDARMYSLLILLSTASMLFFVKFLQEQRRRTGIWWALTTGLAMYTHFYAVFILLCQVAFFLLFLKKRRPLARRFGWALGVIGIIVLPILVLLFSDGGYVNLFAEGAGANPLKVFSVPYTFFAFSLGFSYGPSIAELHWSSSLATIRPYLAQIVLAGLLFSFIFILGLRSLWQERERLAFVLLYLIVPMMGGCLVSLMWPQVSYNVRYVSAALPAYCLILTRGLLATRHRMARWGIMILVLIVTLVSVHHYYYQDKYVKDRYRWAAQYVSTHSEDGDVILAVPLKAFKYYYRGPSVTRSLFWTPVFYQQMITNRVQGFRRSWLVLAREWRMDPEGKMKEYMRRTYPVVRETTFTNLYMGLFDMTAPQGD